MLRVRVSPAAVSEPGKVPHATVAQAANRIEAAVSFFRRDDNGLGCPTKEKFPLDSIRTNRRWSPTPLTIPHCLPRQKYVAEGLFPQAIRLRP